MASHLTITSGAGMGIGSARPFNGQTNGRSDASTDAPDPFAAFLSLAGVENETAGATTTGTASDPLSGLALNADLEGGEHKAPDGPDALAVALNVMLPLDNAAPDSDAKLLLNDLLAGLAELKTKLEAGEPLDEEFLAGLNEKLDALGESLGIDLTALPGLKDLTAALETPLPQDASLASKLTAGLGPLAAMLLDGEAAPEPQTAALGAQVGEKLAALATALENDAIPDDKLAQLGLSADADAGVDTKLAIAKLLATKVTPDTLTNIPALAKPALQLNEPALTGQPADASLEAAQASATGGETAPVAAGGQADPGTSGKDKDSAKQGDDKPSAAAIAASVPDSKPDAQAPGQIQQHAARVDAVAAPRVVQTGYQTSQQQLNLPQIAFELARQTSEGNTRFQIRLDPAELGRIDVQLDIDKSGQVNARLYVEKAETLDLMQRDQRGLEKALHQAGLDSAKTNLEFSLKQNNGGDTGQQGRQPQGRFASGRQAQSDLPEIPPTINLYRASLTASGVNIIA